jgi:hypothetical protein
MFEEAHVKGPLRFQETYFRRALAGAPCLRFSEVELEDPKRVLFYKTDLTHALFYNTDVSEVAFSLVVWGGRNRQLPGIAGRVFPWAPRLWPEHARLFEEEVDTGTHAEYELGPSAKNPDERNYGLIAEVYQQLKRNYDAKGDYLTAGQWHYGEMEMKRLHSRWRWRPLRWLGQHLSLAALYKYASSYGESYVLPLIWLGVVLAAFGALYPVVGLELTQTGGGGVLTYSNWARFFRTHPMEHPAGWWGMLLHSLMTSLSVAGFQRELRYAPLYPWGRLLALAELLLTTTLAGLFALAIRRQFKRS